MMTLTDIRYEALRLASQGMTAGKIAAHLRKEAKKLGHEPVPTSWVQAWLRNAGFRLRRPRTVMLDGGCNVDPNALRRKEILNEQEKY